MASTPTLEDKVALITGSTRGIGWAIAQRLARAGAAIIVNGVSDADRVEQRAQQLRDTYGVPVEPVVADAGDPDALKDCYHRVHRRFERLDILVNNAGVMEPRMLGLVKPEHVDRSFRVNVYGSLYHAQQAFRLMSRKRSGSIINMGSILGREGAAGNSVYSATKGAIVGLTRALAKEFAPFDIRVNAIAAGFIDTDLQSTLSAEQRQQTVETIGLGRSGSPEDVANAAVFLASSQADYITGEILNVDGGMIV